MIASVVAAVEAEEEVVGKREPRVQSFLFD